MKSLIEMQYDLQRPAAMFRVNPGIFNQIESLWDYLTKNDFKAQLRTPDEVYHNAPGFSKSQMDHLKTPLHFSAAHFGSGGLKKQTTALTIGELVHKAILEPELVGERFAEDTNIVKELIEGGAKSPRAMKVYKQWAQIEKDKDKLIVSESQMGMVNQIVSNVYNHPMAGKMLSGGEPEVGMWAKDPETGLLLRMKADFIVQSKGLLIDVKTTEDASPEAFEKTIYNYGLHIQAAAYRKIAELSTGLSFPNFAWIVIEKEYPRAVAVYEADPGALDVGEMRYNKNLSKLAQCVQSGIWPGYAQNAVQIGLPHFAWGKETEWLSQQK